MMVTIFFEAAHKKVILGPKHHFRAQKGPFWAMGAMKRPKRGQTATYRKTESIQSYLRIRGTYDPIESL